jgi:serine/threonine protein phosphatase PrpC
MALVADGLGGAGGGLQASRHVTREMVSAYYATSESWSSKTALEKIFPSVNQWLFDRNCEIGESRLLTTCTCLVLLGRKGASLHVGDTRLYRIRGESLEQLTRDHRHPLSREQLLKAMGMDEHILPDVQEFWLEAGDRFLLTTDGVHGHLSAEYMLQLCMGTTRSQALSELICEAAIEAGSTDNTSCLVIDVEELPLRSRKEAHDEVELLRFPDYLEQGDDLEGYRILAEINRGGMGHIYLAEDRETGMKVALKCPSPDYEGNPIYLERFLREEWVGRRIHAQELLKIFPPKKPRQTYLYLVSEYCPGENLRNILDARGRFSMDDAINVAGQALKALNFLHNMNIVHRDVKLDNFMLSPQGQLKLIDYGIVLMSDLSDLNEHQELVQWMGSPNYMAPEMFKGSRGSVQTDLFSFGVCLYELLAQRLPYGNVDVLNPYRNKQYQSLLDHDPSLPAWFDEVLRRCLALDPQHRFGAASEILYALEHPGVLTVAEQRLPLVERDPVSFWKIIAIVEAFFCLAMTYAMVLVLR